MIQLHVLGASNLRRDGDEVRSVLNQPKRLALLTYLATASPRGFHSRDTLLGLFWPELDQERARNALRQGLHYLRRALGEEVVVGRGDREVGIDPTALWCDAVAFDQAVDEGRHADALILYQGDLLPGFFIEEAPEAERWLEDERARRRRVAVESAWVLAVREEADGEPRAAALWARRAAGLEPLDEGSLRRLLGLLDRAGEPAAALEAYADFARRLEAEYGVAPSAATVEQVERLRARPRTQSAARPAASVRRPPPPVAEPTSESVAEPPAAPALPDRPPTTRRARRLRTPILTAVALFGMLAVGGWWIANRMGSERTATVSGARAADLPSIAVLPFANLSGDPGKEYLSDGLSEEILNVLAQLPEMRVAARTSSFRFRGNEVPVDSIGKLLRVRHVLEGSVREDGGRMRITAQLIDARTGYHVWSQTFDRDMRDVFAVQDEISRAIASALRVRLTGARAAGPLVRQETSDPEAHALVLKGSHVLRTSDRESLARAAEFFEQAIRRDSMYARAYAGLALVLQNQAYRRYVPVDEGYARARAMAERALALDPAQIRAHTVLARIAEIHQWDFAAAEEHYRRAAELNPSTTAYLASRAFLLMRLGRPEEAIAVARRYTEADPDHAGGYNNLGAIYGYARRFEQSLEAFRSALALDPDNPTASLGLALTYSYLGRHGEAATAVERARGRRPNDQYVLAGAGYVLARAGRTPEAAEILRRLRAEPDASAYLQATVLAALGRRDDAFARLSEAVDRREDTVPDLGIDPSLDSLREDPRMGALLRRAGLPTLATRR